MSTSEPTDARHELAAWVVLATPGLVTPARERIQQEIEAHYADAVARHLAAGAPPAAAEARALDELGDLHAAAKGFRKRYLTEKEETWLREFEVGWRRVASRRIATGVGILFGLLGCLGAALWWVRPTLDAFVFQGLCACMVLGGITFTLIVALGLKIRRLLAQHPPGIELRCKLLSLSLALSCIPNLIVAGLLVYSQLMFGRFVGSLRFIFFSIWACVGIVMLAALILPFVRQFRLLRKLRYSRVAGDPGVAA